MPFILKVINTRIELCLFREQVRVNGFGIFILLLYPGAYVDLSTEHLQIISPLRQLRIYCAGVWHNFIIVLASVIFLFVLPWLLVPFYTVGNAVVLTHVLEVSSHGVFSAYHI